MPKLPGLRFSIGLDTGCDLTRAFNYDRSAVLAAAQSSNPRQFDALANPRTHFVLRFPPNHPPASLVQPLRLWTGRARLFEHSVSAALLPYNRM